MTSSRMKLCMLCVLFAVACSPSPQGLPGSDNVPARAGDPGAPGSYPAGYGEHDTVCGEEECGPFPLASGDTLVEMTSPATTTLTPAQDGAE